MWDINRYTCVVAFLLDQITSVNELIRREARQRGTCRNRCAVKPCPKVLCSNNSRINPNPCLKSGERHNHHQPSLCKCQYDFGGKSQLCLIIFFFRSREIGACSRGTTRMWFFVPIIQTARQVRFIVDCRISR